MTPTFAPARDTQHLLDDWGASTSVAPSALGKDAQQLLDDWGASTLLPIQTPTRPVRPPTTPSTSNVLELFGDTGRPLTNLDKKFEAGKKFEGKGPVDSGLGARTNPRAQTSKDGMQGNLGNRSFSKAFPPKASNPRKRNLSPHSWTTAETGMTSL